jgi:hypothetical protein
MARAAVQKSEPVPRLHYACIIGWKPAANVIEYPLPQGDRILHFVE